MTTAVSTRNAIADLWGLLAELLSFPGATLEQEVRGGSVRSAVAHLTDHLGWDIAPLLEGLDAGAGEESLESEFIRLFDAPDGASTPLYTGVYSRRRRDAMEELLRFYRHFGLTVSGEAHDLPDYVPTVLEFLRFLALAAAADGSGNAAETAAADVIERHVGPWASQTVSRLKGRRPHPFYATVVLLVESVCEIEQERRLSESEPVGP